MTRAVIVGFDPGGQDHTGWVVAERQADGSFLVIDSGAGKPPPEIAATLTLLHGTPRYEIGARLRIEGPPPEPPEKLAGDTAKSRNGGGPPAHTLKSYNRKRSQR